MKLRIVDKVLQYHVLKILTLLYEWVLRGNEMTDSK